MKFAFRITKTMIQTHTHNIEYLLLFHGKNGYANKPQCYLIRAMPVSLLDVAALKSPHLNWASIYVINIVNNNRTGQLHIPHADDNAL